MLNRRKTLILLLIFTLFSGASYCAQNDDQDLFLVAQKALEDGFYDVAIRYIDQLFTDFPETEKRVQANLILGQCYFFKSQYIQAYDIFNKLTQYPEFKDMTLFWLGETYLKVGSYKDAEKQYQQIIDIYPKSAYVQQAYYSLGWVYFAQNEFTKAMNIFKSLVLVYPDNQLSEDAAFKIGEAAFNLKDYAESIKSFKQYLLDYPDSLRTAETYFYIAESYYYSEDPLTASTYYAKAADASSDSKLTLMSKVSMGWSYLKLKKFDLAQKSFDEALTLSQEKEILSDDVFLGQANLFSEMGEQEKALEAYDNLIRLFPDSSRVTESYLGKANIHYILHDYPAAIDAYKYIIDLFADHKEIPDILEKAYFGLAWAYLKSGNIDACIDSFNAIKDRTASKIIKISALTQIGDAYQDIDRLDKAIEVYDQILSQYPESAYIDYVQYRQAIALLKIGDLQTAGMAFQSLRTNFPQSAYLTDAKYYLAVTYFKRKDWNAAQQQIKEFIASTPKENEFLPEAYYILALTHFNLRNLDEARKTYAYLIKNFPQDTKLNKRAEIGIAKTLYEQGDVKEAVKRFKIIAYKFPKDQVAQESLILLGDHYLGVSDYTNAELYYNQYIKNFPGEEQYPYALYALGQAFHAEGKFDKALEAYKKINAGQEKQLFVKARLAIAEIFTQETDPDSALATYENIIQSSPEFARDAYTRIAKVQQKEQHYQESIEAYAKALSSPQGLSQISDAELQFHTADAYELLKDNQRAVEEYLKIPYLYPSNTPWIIKSYLRTAKLFENQEKWSEAKIIYGKIIQFNTDELKFAKERLDWIAQNIRTDLTKQ